MTSARQVRIFIGEVLAQDGGGGDGLKTYFLAAGQGCPKYNVNTEKLLQPSAECSNGGLSYVVCSSWEGAFF